MGINALKLFRLVTFILFNSLKDISDAAIGVFLSVLFCLNERTTTSSSDTLYCNESFSVACIAKGMSKKAQIRLNMVRVRVLLNINAK